MAKRQQARSVQPRVRLLRSSVCAGPSTSEHASLDAVSASVDSRSTSQRRGLFLVLRAGTRGTVLHYANIKLVEHADKRKHPRKHLHHESGLVLGQPN